MDESYNTERSEPGPKLILKLSWGCFIFFVVMLGGTWLIGNYFGTRIKKRVDLENEKAESQLIQQRNKRDLQANPRPPVTNHPTPFQANH